jgi:hypothetical protein
MKLSVSQTKNFDGMFVGGTTIFLHGSKTVGLPRAGRQRIYVDIYVQAVLRLFLLIALQESHEINKF